MTKECEFKIVIVEDHIQSAVYISNMLEFEGFCTYQAYNAHDALRIIQKEKPDLVLLDLKLDGTTGYDIAEKIGNTRVFLMTSFEIEDKIKNKYKNVIDIFVKPLNIHEVIGKIRQTLRVPKKEA